MVTMETKSAVSWVLVPNISIPNFIHLYTSITELWAIMLFHHFGRACLAALYNPRCAHAHRGLIRQKHE